MMYQITVTVTQKNHDGEDIIVGTSALRDQRTFQKMKLEAEEAIYWQKRMAELCPSDTIHIERLRTHDAVN